MMYVAYFSGFSLPRQGVASRVLRQAAVFNHAPSKVVYWLVAMADLALSRAQLLPEGVPVVAYVTYQLHRSFRPVGQPAGASSLATLADKVGGKTLSVPNGQSNLARQPRHSQGRDYLLSQQQAVYDELFAKSWVMPEGVATTLQPEVELLSVAEITRDLAGWSPPTGMKTKSEGSARQPQQALR